VIWAIFVLVFFLAVGFETDSLHSAGGCARSRCLIAVLPRRTLQRDILLIRLVDR